MFFKWIFLLYFEASGFSWFKLVENEFKPEVDSLTAAEKKHIEYVLTKNNWNISRAARELDIDRQTLYNKIEKYGIKKGES